MTLAQRVETAMKAAGKNQRQVAIAIDVTPQTFTNLKRRPGSTLKPEHLAKTARFLNVDLYWPVSYTHLRAHET